MSPLYFQFTLPYLDEIKNLPFLNVIFAQEPLCLPQSPSTSTSTWQTPIHPSAPYSMLPSSRFLKAEHMFPPLFPCSGCCFPLLQSQTLCDYGFTHLSPWLALREWVLFKGLFPAWYFIQTWWMSVVCKVRLDGLGRVFLMALRSVGMRWCRWEIQGCSWGKRCQVLHNGPGADVPIHQAENEQY